MQHFQFCCVGLSLGFDFLYIFGNTVFNQIIGIPMETNWASLIADLSL
jgi:hypothetical protein